MTKKLQLTLAIGDYEIVRALKEGAVQADVRRRSEGREGRERHQHEQQNQSNPHGVPHESQSLSAKNRDAE